jgi:hypothetical protein
VVTRFAMAAATLLVLHFVAGAAAQSSANNVSSDLGEVPVAIDGWRHFNGPNDLHVYLCDHPGCAPGSKVSFLLYPPGAIFPGMLRRQRDTVGEMLQERSAPCTLVDGISLLLSRAPGPMHCIATAPDGTRTYDATGIIDGLNLSASLISSSRDEAASEANYGQFGAALKTLTNSDVRAKR